MEKKENLKNSVHHMVMACLSGDLAYLVNEHDKLTLWYNYREATPEELEIIYEVSLEAAMEGRVDCLVTMYEIGIPMHELCPIIAACHGHKDVVDFCETISLGNYQEAWNRYFHWIICQQRLPNDDTVLVGATEWVSNYKSSRTMISCSAK